jgi:hypothetical protein
MTGSVLPDAATAKYLGATAFYALGSSPAERDRLRRQSGAATGQCVDILCWIAGTPAAVACDRRDRRGGRVVTR